MDTHVVDDRLSPNRYKYDVLPDGSWIRVLHLQPGEDSEPLVCQLKFVDISKNPKYESISYHWGDPDNTTPITCDGRIMDVTVNLCEALRTLRLQNAERVLWADAICINQSDLDERQEQVGLMGNVYASAEQVIAWLGLDSDNNVTAAFRLADKLSDHYQKEKELYGSIFQIPHMEADDIAEEDVPEWVAMSELLKRPWFSRAWVIQEVCLANRCVLQCGQHQLRKEALDDAGWLLVARGRTMMLRFDMNPVWQPAWQLYDEEYIDRWSFLQLLDIGRGLITSDSRDQIYAFLAHPSSEVGPSASSTHAAEKVIEPDYTRDVSQVYTALAMRYIKRGDLTILSAIQHWTTPDPGNGLPSWVPDWALPRISDSMGIRDFQDTEFNACLNVPAENTTILDGDRIMLQGLQVDIVDWCSKPRDDMGSYSWSPWQEMPPDHSSSLAHGTFLDKSDSLMLALIFGIWYASAAISRLAEVRSCFQAYSAREEAKTREPHSEVDGLQEPIIRQKSSRFATPCYESSLRRRLFTTKRGFFGLGPGIMEEGDICCVLFGGRVPFILRPTSQENHYLFIGECYVLEIMNGEAIKMKERGELFQQEFILT